MSWSMDRSTSTLTPCRRMIEALTSMSPAVLETSGDRLSVPLRNIALRPVKSQSCSVLAMAGTLPTSGRRQNPSRGRNDAHKAHAAHLCRSWIVHCEQPHRQYVIGDALDLVIASVAERGPVRRLPEWLAGGWIHRPRVLRPLERPVCGACLLYTSPSPRD